MPENDGLFSKISPKTSFFTGVGVMAAIFFIIGFFVLLGIILKDKKDDGKVVAEAPKAGDVGGAAQPTAQDITVKEVSDEDWIRGSASAKITVVEYSDLECPFCKSFHPTMKKLIEEYPNDVNWVYRHFPLIQLHSQAPKEAEASECAGELGGNEAFWKYLDRIFEVTPSNNGLDLSELPKIAKDIGLDEAKFSSCLDSGKYAQKIEAAIAEAGDAGAQGTPYSVILSGDQKVPVSGALPYSELKAYVDSVLKQ